MVLDHNASVKSLITALELQRDWGVESVTENIPWQPLEAPTPILGQRKPERAKSTQIGSYAGQSSKKASADVTIEVTDIESLKKYSDHIKDSTLAKTATHHLLPILSDKARFIIIGEVPDDDEDRSGVLFSGQAGQYLEKILKSIGLKQSDASLIPAMPWRPPGGRPLLPQELKVGAEIMQHSLALSWAQNGALPIITMGTTALHILFKKPTRITKVRGKWHDITLSASLGQAKLLPTFHPLQLRAGSVVRKGLWQDMILLAETLGI
ncbi:hypothetical protein GT348_06485 [Aristophania vespae]|uniref:Uracil-DNA glycosylase-like domain-containing protein n=1 Tax=Aristophania vespae TaxID=2697033 RepID=A0A6P1NB99_9PROT|nr:uracil-DNA glycosylase [Aristophania vespae]QHI95935.1 hypothetical protein GT348_06485 [Aristophania vespae]